MILRCCFRVGSGWLKPVTHRDSLLAAVVATIWGFNFVVIDWGMAGVPPLLFAAVRFTVVVFPAVLVVRRLRDHFGHDAKQLGVVLDDDADALLAVHSAPAVAAGLEIVAFEQINQS